MNGNILFAAGITLDVLPNVIGSNRQDNRVTSSAEKASKDSQEGIVLFLELTPVLCPEEIRLMRWRPDKSSRQQLRLINLEGPIHRRKGQDRVSMGHERNRKQEGKCYSEVRQCSRQGLKVLLQLSL